MKGGVEFDPKKVKIENLDQYSSLCGWALALAHAKSGDAAMIAGYVGNSDELDEAMVRFAFAYADQTEKDYQALADASKERKNQSCFDERIKMISLLQFGKQLCLKQNTPVLKKIKRKIPTGRDCEI